MNLLGAAWTVKLEVNVFYMKRLKSYLSYNTISGIQIESDGTRIDVIPA